MKIRAAWLYGRRIKCYVPRIRPNAQKIISATVINGTDPTDAGSMTKDFIEVDDCPTQLKKADSISKLKGHLSDSNQTNLQINFNELSDSQLQEIIDGKLPKDII